MERSQFAAVIFDQVAETYPTDSDVACQFELTETLEASKWDWVGLYKVGWTKQNDYLHYQYVAIPDGYSKGKKVPFKIVWQAKYLPKEDGDFYQFCYVSYAHGISGASTPFQFRKPRAADFVEEEFEGMMVVRPKTVVMQEEIQNLQHKLMMLDQERDSMAERLSATQKKVDTRDHMISGLQTQLGDLHKASEEWAKQCDELTAQREALQDLLEVAMKEKEAALQEIQTLRVQLENTEQVVTTMKAWLKDMKSHEDELSGQNQSLLVELNAYKMQVTESQSLAAQHGKSIEELQAKLDEVKGVRLSLSEEFAKLLQQEEKKTQELAQQTKDLDRVKAEKVDLERHRDDLANEVQNARDMLMACQSMKEKLVGDLSAYEQTQLQMNSKLESQESEVRDLQEKLERAVKDCSEGKKRLNNKTQELASVSEALAISENNLKQVLSQFHETSSRQKETLQQQAAVERQRVESSQQLDLVKAELHKAREEKDALQIQLSTFEDDLKEIMEAREKVVTGKEEELALMTAALKEKDEELKTKDAMIARQAAQLDALSEDLEKKIQDIQALSQSLDEAREEGESLSSEKEEALVEIEKRSLEDEGAKFVLKSTNECLTKRIREKDTELDRLKQEVGGLDEEVRELRQRLDLGRVEYQDKAVENQRLERMLKKQTMFLRKSSEGDASSPECWAPSEGACCWDRAAADYDRHKYRQKYKTERADKEAKLQALQDRHADEMFHRDDHIRIVRQEADSMLHEIADLRREKESLEVADAEKNTRIMELEGRVCYLLTRLQDARQASDYAEEEEDEDEREGEEQEEEEETKLMYGNPFAVAAAAETARTEPLKQSIIRSTLEEEVGRMAPLIEASTEGDRLPPPLEPQVVTAAATEDPAGEETGQDMFEDCAAELPTHPADDSFMDAIGEGMMICPECHEWQTNMLSARDFEEHVATHFGRICPVCKSQADDTMTIETFEQHVNKCLDCEAHNPAANDEDFAFL